MSDSLYRSRPLVLFGVLAFWSICLIEALPPANAVHQKIDDFFEPLLNRTSLWQNNWELFAPDIDHWNSSLECVITWEDGTQTVWTHPEWTTASWWVKFRNFRLMEYYESLIVAYGRPAWPAFMRAKSKQIAEAEGKTPRLAELIYRGDSIAPPQEVWRKAYSAPDFSPPVKVYTWYPHAVSESEIQLYGN